MTCSPKFDYGRLSARDFEGVAVTFGDDTIRYIAIGNLVIAWRARSSG